MAETEFWQALTRLCKERNTSPSAVAKTLGFAAGSPTAWKKGAQPSLHAIGSLATYFDVPMEVFYGLPDRSKEKSPAGNPEEDMDNLVKFALFGPEPISDEVFQMVKDFARIAAERERQEKMKKEE